MLRKILRANKCEAGGDYRRVWDEEVQSLYSSLSTRVVADSRLISYSGCFNGSLIFIFSSGGRQLSDLMYYLGINSGSMKAEESLTPSC
jgi:hypothetical protein